MTSDEQLRLWVTGESRCPNENGGCCPDFSCCVPELTTDESERRAFADGDDALRHQMLMGFLVKALAAAADEESPEVHVAGMADGVEGELQ